jgi:hypothetical protein
MAFVHRRNRCVFMIMCSIALGAACVIAECWLLSIGFAVPDRIVENRDISNSEYRPTAPTGVPLTWLTRRASFGRRVDLWHPSAGIGTTFRRAEHLFGWPFYCMRYVEVGEYGIGAGATIVGGIIVRPDRGFGSPAKVLPMTPVVPGCAVSAGAHSVAICIAWGMLNRIRRTLRRKCGCCASCGYSLSGICTGSNMCPECGEDIAKSGRH